MGDNLNMIDAQSERYFVKRHDGWVAESSLEIGEVLLSEAGLGGQLLLGQALRESDSPNVSADQSPHIHGGRVSK